MPVSIYAQGDYKELVPLNELPSEISESWRIMELIVMALKVSYYNPFTQKIENDAKIEYKIVLEPYYSSEQIIILSKTADREWHKIIYTIPKKNSQKKNFFATLHTTFISEKIISEIKELEVLARIFSKQDKIVFIDYGEVQFNTARMDSVNTFHTELGVSSNYSSLKESSWK